MNYLLLDVETTNDIKDPLVYDIGYQIINERGEVQKERSMLVEEVFDSELMECAYYAEKIPEYKQALRDNKITKHSLYNVRMIILNDIRNFNVQTLVAYNAHFDRNALNTTYRYITKSKRLYTNKHGISTSCRWFFPYGLEWACIWNMASTSFMQTKEYQDFTIENGYFSKAGNITTNAEVAYRYLKQDTDFIEDHTGLEDVKIEREIFQYVRDNFTDYETEVNRLAWRVPQQALPEGTKEQLKILYKEFNGDEK